MNYYHRFIESSLVSPSSRNKIKILFGARQTGKSTLLRYLLGEQALFIDLQDSSKRLEFERRPKAFSEILLGKKEKKTVVVVDEIQKVPSLLDEVQWLYDSHPERFVFFLTGSSARRLRTSASNLLPGRSHLFHLNPLTAWEQTPAPDCEILPSPRRSPSPLFPSKTLEDLLIFGSLPGVFLEQEESARRTLEGYVELYLEEEIRREGLAKDPGAFSRFLELAAMESGQMMNLTKLSSESGTPMTTIRLYYQVLVDTFIGYWLEPFTKKSRKRLLTTPRFYFFDLGVRHAAARLPFDNSLIKMQKRQLLEHWVALELIHRVQALGRDYRVSFWRTVGGAEVDFVLETPEEVIPIEVKWTDSPSVADIRHLQIFLEDYRSKAQRAYLICRVAEKRQLADHVWAIPWSQL